MLFRHGPKQALFVALAIFASSLVPSSSASATFEVTTFSGINGKGSQIKEVGESGTTSMAPDGTLYIADRKLFSIRKFKNGVFTDFVKYSPKWDPQRGRSAVPCGVFAKSVNEIYVSYCDLKSVDLYNGSGVLQRTYLVNVGIQNMGFDWGGGLVVNSSGDIFLSEEENHVIIKINGSTGASEIYAGNVGVRGFVNGAARSATFNVPRGLLIDAQGSLLVADTVNNAVRKIDSNRQVSTLLGLRCEPMGLDMDSKGAIYVVGGRNCGGYIYKIGTGAIYDDSATSTNCSIPSCVIGQPAFAANATISIDRFGNSPSDNIFITDYANGNLQVFSSAGRRISTFGGSNGYGVTTFLPGSENQLYNFPINVFPVEDGTYLAVDLGSVRHIAANGEILRVTFLPSACWYSRGVAITPDGTLFCSDWRKIMVRFPDGQLAYIGSGINEHRDGNSSNAGFQSVAGMAVWGEDLYVLEDAYSGYLRKVSRVGNTRNFQVTTVFGSGNTSQEPTNYMERGSVILRYPNQIAFDLSGNLFITGTDTYLWKTDLKSSSPVTRIPGDFDSAWVNGVATDDQGRAFVSTHLGSVYLATNVISRITPTGHGRVDGPANQASFTAPRVTFVDQQGDLLVADTHNQLIRKINVGTKAGYGVLKTAAAKPFMVQTSSSNSGNSSNSSNQAKPKPAKPSFSAINFSDNKINISVNIGSGSNRPDKVYLVAPKLGANASNPIAGTIAGALASWSIDVDKALSGVAIPLEIVSEKDGVKSDPLDGSYKFPNFSTEASKVPPAPTDFKSRIVGNAALITANTAIKSGAIPTSAYLISKNLGISKQNALPGEIIGKKLVFEVPVKAKMAGKKYPVTIFSTNAKGESKLLNGVLAVPALPKVPIPNINNAVPKPPQTIICVRPGQTRAFTGTKCPPGWNQG